MFGDPIVLYSRVVKTCLSVIGSTKHCLELVGCVRPNKFGLINSIHELVGVPSYCYLLPIIVKLAFFSSL